MALALGYTLPLAWRRRAPLAALAAIAAAILAMSLALTPVEHLFVPFLAVLSLVYAAPRTATGARPTPALALIVAAMPVIVATFDDRRRRLRLPVAARRGRVARGPRRARRTRLTAELHEAAARLAEASEDEQRSPRSRSGAGSRARCTTSSRTR